MTDPYTAIRSLIDDAPIVPPALGGWRPESIAPSASRPGLAVCRGVVGAEDGESIRSYGIPDPLYLFVDLNRCRRILAIDGLDRDGIASLHAGDDAMLARLWPSSRRHWNRWSAPRAAEELIAHQHRIGIVAGRGFGPLLAEAPAAIAAHSAISRLAGRLLRRRVEPLAVLELAHGWDASRGAALGRAIVHRIVDAACGRELARLGLDRAA